MKYSDLIEEVQLITNRPDLAAETASAVKSATLKAHQSDFYARDIYETDVIFSSSNYLQSIDLPQLICNFRSLKYLRRYDIKDSPESGIFLDIITSDEVLDSYGRNKSDIAYMAGRMLEIRAAAAFEYAILGCYVFPLVTPESKYSSWIADMHPYAIINEAARVIFKMIGYDEQSAQYNTLVAEEYQTLKMTGLAEAGY